jgi:hypothetical protein
MMTNIVERLEATGGKGQGGPLKKEAADEIRKLRAIIASAQGALLPALIEIRNWCMVEGCSEQVDVADKAMIAAGVKDIPCFQCSGDGQWDEGPLSVSSSAQISPEYRTVICEECTGSGRLYFSLSSAERAKP